jgi:hypothetical protein
LREYRKRLMRAFRAVSRYREGPISPTTSSFSSKRVTS